MNLDNAIYALSNINAIMGSSLGYMNDRQNGIPAGYAMSNMGYNIMNGALRNEASRQIHNMTGSYLGYAVNNAAGYGSPEANYAGTMGTIGAAMISSPFGIFNPYGTSALYGCGPYGGGYWNSGFFGGCGCNSFAFGGPSLFGIRGFWC